jgi:folate-binding protein YgfZ
VHAELDRMLIMEDAELELRERELSWFRLHGPLSATRARSLAGEHGGVSAAIDWLGLGGAALAVPLDAAASVASAAGDSLLTDADWLRLRLERGLPEIGTDYSERDRPHEAGLERRAVSWSKGCYLGQEVVCMQDMRGKVRRSNRVLSVSADPGADLASGQSVVGATGEPCGVISATIHSPRAGAWLAMCRLELSALANELFVQTAAERYPATLAEPV